MLLTAVSRNCEFSTKFPFLSTTNIKKPITHCGSSITSCGRSITRYGDAITRCGGSITRCGDAITRCGDAITRCGRSITHLTDIIMCKSDTYSPKIESDFFNHFTFFNNYKLGTRVNPALFFHRRQKFTTLKTFY